MVTLFPFTTSPFSLVLLFHPTPVPWSARHIQVWSTIVSLLLIFKFTQRAANRGATYPEEDIV